MTYFDIHYPFETFLSFYVWGIIFHNATWNDATKCNTPNISAMKGKDDEWYKGDATYLHTRPSHISIHRLNNAGDLTTKTSRRFFVFDMKTMGKQIYRYNFLD